MKITRNVKLEEEVIEKLRERNPRTGWHISETIYCPRKSYFKRSGVFEVGSENTPLLFARGEAHHVVLEVFQPNEISEEMDGLKGTIDMVKERPIEIFTTILSSKRKAYYFTNKIKQLKSYCYMRKRIEGDLLIFHLLGDYTDRKPQLRAWTLDFTESELEANWLERLYMRSYIKDCLNKEIIPKEKGLAWECTSCGYEYICRVEGLDAKSLMNLAKLYEVI